MSDKRKPYLIVIRAGPSWDLQPLVTLARVLGERYEGEVWTFSNDATVVAAGDFKVVRDRLPESAGIPMVLARAARLVGRGLRRRWMEGRRLVVITYDPFKQGIVGAALRWLAGAKFICEVNGVYGDADNLADVADREAAARKRKRMLNVGSLVLRQAHCIKLLFPKQLDGFDVPDRIPRAVFMDFVDWPKFQPCTGESERILLFIGHPLLRKGVDVLLKAYARVRSDYPDWRLVLIGFQLEEQVLARDLPLEGVDLLGPQPPEAISAWMERSRAIILPSRSEAMGRVMIEAALKSRARLASRIGGIPTYVEHEVDGLLFEPDDQADLEATLRRFMGDPALGRRLGQAARARAEKEFTAAAYLEQYARLVDPL